MAETRAKEIIDEFNRVSSNRTNWESHWEEVAQRVIPSYSNLFVGHGENYTKGAKKTDYMFDSTASTALVRFAAAMESMLTPRNQKWHALAPSDPALMKDRAVRLYLEQTNDLLFKYRYAPKANFAGQQHQAYMEIGAFGSNCLFIDGLAGEPGLRYRAVHLGEAYFMENHQGQVDKILRKFPFTARQAAQKWGESKLPDKVKNALARTPETEFFFIHCVKPNDLIDNKRVDYRGMEFASYYVSMDDPRVLQEGGYNSFPYAVGRYVQSPGEVYGRSPAMEALPAIKTLNEEKKTALKQGHRQVDPVLLVHDDGILSSFSLRPGAVNSGAVTAEGRSLVHTLPTGNLAVSREMMLDERASINDAFLVTLFQILVDTPQMTATEVLERAREKGALLSPTMGRQQSEYLGPLIVRELDLLSRQGLLPEMPPAMREAGGEFEIVYSSPLSRAQKAEEASGFMRTLETALQVVNVAQDPSVLDHFDFDTIIPDVAEIQAMPVRWTRSLDAIATIRDQRAKQAQTQTMIQAAPAVAGIMKAMGGPKSA